MDTVSAIALTLGVGWASGINLYAAVFMLGLMSSTGNVVLPPSMEVVADPMVMGAAGLMYCVEFFADKTPGIDTGWDAIHTFIRIPAGAILAMSAAGDVSPAADLTAFLLGGSLAAGAHATKAGTRIMINTSPEPVSNWMASITEDLLVIGAMWSALYHPTLFLIFLAIFIILMIWLLPILWRGIKRLAQTIRNFFSPAQETDPTINLPPGQ